MIYNFLVEMIFQTTTLENFVMPKKLNRVANMDKVTLFYPDFDKK